MKDIFAKLTNIADIANNKIDAYCEEKLAQLEVFRDQLIAKVLQIYKDVKNSEILESSFKKNHDEYELRSKQVIEFGIEKKTMSLNTYQRNYIWPTITLMPLSKNKKKQLYVSFIK